MGLFYEVLSAINNPNQPASTDQLSLILNTVQQVAGSRGLSPATTQTLMSVLGGHVRSALQQQRMTSGGSQLETMLSQFGGTDATMGLLQSLFTPQQQQQMLQDTVQRTGISADTVKAILPTLLPAVLNLLKMGSAGSQGSNTILSAFLDSDKDGDADLGDAMVFANRFLNPSR
ncbi:MAG: hypothetical protein HC769_25590 [Cyanobacteria bacterium CRU_2_1]|nr:hypothetical protein [Cyanobacteria bacterium RU_5_0]NJR61906.1 hypothetical protein [Cyanobacteria bacterium CRU_2_1]